MAASYVPGADEPTYGAEAVFHGKALRRSWSSNSSSSSSSASSGGVHRCICAPPTHAGAFKCRFHRNNPPASHHHHHQAAPVPRQPQATETARSVHTQ